MTVLAEIKVRVAETPDIKAFGFAFRGNWLGLGNNDRFAQTAILAKKIEQDGVRPPVAELLFPKKFSN